MSDKFNLKELTKDWEDNFYEGDWEVGTLSMTKVEVNIHEKLSEFLPRHMLIYDWNLPYADEIILIIRREMAKAKGADERSGEDET